MLSYWEQRNLIGKGPMSFMLMFVCNQMQRIVEINKLILELLHLKVSFKSDREVWCQFAS